MKTWRFLERLVRYRPGLYALNALIWCLSFLAPIAVALISRAFFNRLTGDAPVGWHWTSLIALMLAAHLARIALEYSAVLVEVTTTHTVGALLRRNLFDRILRRPGADALARSPGEAISRFRDDVNELMESPSWLVFLIGQTLFAVIALIIMARLHPLITLVVFLPLTAVAALFQAAGARLERYRRASREATGRVTEFLGEIFGAAQAVKVASAEEHVVERFRALNDERRRASLRDRLFSELLNSLFFNTAQVGTGAILILAGQAMRSGAFTVGDLALFEYFLWWTADYAYVVGTLVARYRQWGVSLERMAALLRGEPAAALVEHHPVWLSGPPPEAEPPAGNGHPDRLHSLEVRGLTYRYPSSGRGIEGIDLQLARGSFTVITGRVGAGKTTLLRVLLGLLPREAGEILWNGFPIEDPGAFFVPPYSAYTPQVPRLFSETLRANLLLGLREEKDGLQAALWSAVMEEDVAALEEGLETVVGPRGVKLSGGQVQRSAAGRMFVRAPELLVFDDLSSALDVETERTLWERLFARGDVTCLVVSHRRPALRRAQEIVLLKNGRVEARGALAELLAASEEMRRLWREEESPGGPRGD